MREDRIAKAVLGGMGFDFTDPEWDRRLAFADAFTGRQPPSELTGGAIDYAKSIGADLQALGYLQDYQPVTRPEELLGIDTEVLVIAGNEDRDNGDPAKLQAHLPNSRLVLVEGDHDGTYRQANFAAAVLSFIRS